MSIKLKDTIYDLINNADKLDGSHLTDIIRYYAPSSSNVLNLDDLKSTTGFQVTGWAYAGSPYVNSQPGGDGASSAATVIKFPGNYPFQIYRFYSSNDIKVRGYYSGTGWTSWATILTSDNYTTYCAPASHSHNYASTVKVGSTSYSCSSNVISLPAYPTIPTSLKCPKSLTIQLNGTSQGAWDGSADKTINITPASIGASATHSHPYLPIAGGTMTGAINFQIGTQTALINARYDGTNYTNILWHKHGDSSGVGSTVIFGSPLWENVILETKANQNCAYRQTSGTKYKIWDSGNDGSGSGLDADTLDGVHLMGKGGTSGVMRSWARGTYTTSKQYFGNGNVIVIDPKPTDDSSLWANTTIFSIGDMEIRSHQLAFGYNEDKILYRRISDGPKYNAWKTIAFTDSKVNNAGYADNSGQLNGYGEGNYYRQSRGALNNADLNTFVKRNSGGYSINYSGYSGLLVSLQGNGGSTSSIEFIATHYDIKTGGLKVRYTVDSSWYGDTKSIAFLDSNVASASKLATARTISLTGSITGSGSFDGSGNLSIATTTNHTHSYYPLSGNTNMSGDNVWIGSTMGGGTDYWKIGGYGSSDNGICRITIGDNSNDKFQIQIADYSGTTYTPLEVTYNKVNIVGLTGITANGRTLTIGSQNADHCHYSTDAPCHWFNKLVRVAGDVYGGSSYNRRLAYVDEVALSGHTHSYLSTNIAGSLSNTATVNYANTPYGVNYRNHYSGHGLGSYRGVLTCKDNSVGFELNSYWCVNPADGVGTNNLYYRVKRDAASDWGPYARIIDSGNIGSQSVSYANSAGSVAWGNVSGKPSSFTPSAHTHNYAASNHSHTYYWANVAVSTSSSTTTSPTFGHVSIYATGTGISCHTSGTNSVAGHFQNANCTSKLDSYATVKAVTSGSSYVGFYTNGKCRYASASSTSDRRLKKDIKYLTEYSDEYINKIDKIDFASFRYNDSKDENSFLYGFIAQDVQKYFPEIVDSSNEYLCLDYNSCFVLKIASLERKIKILEEKLKEVNILF